ncbi:CDP-diacylglycerol--glycerol-3-phosphate 3-phosphatidyltransferase [Leucothrix pacifica]|uniref:CDP-diacylglycerol--glycerol-3-phosphate 3-phosphatidyltransferase n=1 Tax=Leucothrix pacifica TaxID=1247513 RepID=A0A317CNR8_9GAMM|nr:CDP-diacylglycerol--glycerol-3-phosphate 3-phosphatidyltransferase [Leucothrix pacifica]PWQ99133.1 CDP-diacylglycerol--glycerol-3-phosphate 3-phosphatidyltransferase [Leucothrix pacifica]
MILNIPIMLTYLRILAIPLMVVLFYLDYPLTTAIVFALAGFTDWADGYLARRWGQESRFGAFLDPVADKLMVAVALILIVESQANAWVTIAAAIIVSRELLISALREWMAEVGQRSKVAVAFTGKLKTAAQIMSLTFLLYDKPLWGIPLHEIGLALLAIATILTVWSMMQYLADAFRNEPTS